MNVQAVAIRPAQQVANNDIMESVLIKGDLSRLTPEERSTYYLRVCESVGLNPFTKPFEYITLNGKLTLYALRACTDQLRSRHNVSVLDLTETERDGVFIVTAKMQNGEGRTDMAKGAVTIGGLKGDALANAIMKAETKAKRRATLSLCGLGFLDETELETIPSTVKSEDAPKTTLPKKDAKDIYARLQTEMRSYRTRDSLRQWGEANAERIAVMPRDWQDILRLQYQEMLVDLQYHEDKPKAPPITEIGQWLQWLDGQLAQFTNLRALEGYWNTTIDVAMANGPIDELDRDMALATFARHQTRIEAAEAAK